MRRDICYLYPLDVVRVYEGFLKAATSDPFRRDCSKEPYYRIGFGINFSMKYNMNGGSCTIHFMPYQGGTAVNLRFSIAQLAGARYEKYAEDLNKYAAKNLGVSGKEIELDVELFTNPANQIKPQSAPKPAAAPQPAPIPQPVVVPQHVVEAQPITEEKSFGFCSRCGSALLPEAAFCSKCGTKVVNQDRACSRCGKIAPEDAAFCAACGNRL